MVLAVQLARVRRIANRRQANEDFPVSIKAICFDVGETLVDETRHWGTWADYVGVPRFTFFAVLGALIRDGRHHRDVFRVLVPSFDYEAAVTEGRLCGKAPNFLPSDLYPDAIPTLRRLKSLGYMIGVAGNQPEECETALHAAGIEADFLASSATWRVEKPSTMFFSRLVAETGFQPHEVVYVGDRLDNDMLPAANAGLVAVQIVRGPWAYISASAEDRSFVQATVRSLTELPETLAGL